MSELLTSHRGGVWMHPRLICVGFGYDFGAWLRSNSYDIQNLCYQLMVVPFCILYILDLSVCLYICSYLFTELFSSAAFLFSALTSNFKEFSIKQVSRSENKKADALSKIASTSFTHLSKQVLVEELKEKSINEKEVLAVVEEEGHTWMTPVYEYLTKETLQEDKKKARVWGIDIAGPFPEGPGKVKFLIVVIDYFTKWIKAKPIMEICENPFKDWCEKLSIRQCFASVKHPQTNGLVERANKSLGEGIKARLDERSKDWMGELSQCLWAHHTMIKSSNRETPFSLTYGTEAVIPAEIGMPTLRTVEIDLIKNDEALEINLDLIEEKREQAAIQEAKSKAKMEKYYNFKFRGTSFKPGDMVYRNNDASHAKDGGKLGPKWEGSYEVAESLGKGAYKLKDGKGNELPRT
ncbi:reverse transcriptase domain-containing protein [Tanacetum coccineum]